MIKEAFTVSNKPDRYKNVKDGKMRIPNRCEVTRTFSETEAFDHASELYCDWVTRNTPPPSMEIVSELENKVFRPAVELQLAGLSMLGDRDMKAPTNLVSSFASFSVDHLLWGWFAAVNFHPRIAFSLSRSALEASIFAIAATVDYSLFKSIWDTRRGTGGFILNELKKSTAIPKDLLWFLDSAWQVMKKLGHASNGPVLSAMTKFSEGGEIKTGITFAGQFGGSLDAWQLENCVNAFCLAATAGVEAMNIGLKPLFPSSNEWYRRFVEFQEKQNKQVPIPDYLADHIDEFRKYFGEKPEK